MISPRPLLISSVVQGETRQPPAAQTMDGTRTQGTAAIEEMSAKDAAAAPPDAPSKPFTVGTLVL